MIMIHAENAKTSRHNNFSLRNILNGKIGTLQTF